MRKKLLLFVIYTTVLMLGIYISLYQYTILRFSQHYALNSAFIGLLIGMQHVGMAVSPLLLGVASAKIGKKKVILIAFF